MPDDDDDYGLFEGIDDAPPKKKKRPGAARPKPVVAETPVEDDDYGLFEGIDASYAPDVEAPAPAPSRTLASSDPMGPPRPPTRELRIPSKPSILDELGRSTGAFVEGATGNLLDELTGIGTYAGQKLGLIPGESSLGEAIDTAHAHGAGRQMARDYPASHVIGQTGLGVTGGMLAGTVAPASMAAQAALQGGMGFGIGAGSEYADSRDVGRSLLSGGISGLLSAGGGAFGVRGARKHALTPAQATEEELAEIAAKQRLPPEPTMLPEPGPAPAITEAPRPQPAPPPRLDLPEQTGQWPPDYTPQALPETPPASPLDELLRKRATPYPLGALDETPAPRVASTMFDEAPVLLEKPAKYELGVLDRAVSPAPKSPIQRMLDEATLKERIAIQKRAAEEARQSGLGQIVDAGLGIGSRLPLLGMPARALRTGLRALGGAKAAPGEVPKMVPNLGVQQAITSAANAGAQTTAAGLNYAYGDMPTMEGALKSLLSSGDSGLNEEDAKSFTSTLLSGAKEKISSELFRLQLKSDEFRKNVEQANKTLQD